MCGILGFQLLNNEKINYRKKLESLIYSLSHRGPDSNGFWLDNNKRIYLGHTRLSIIDLSEKGTQPMQSNNGRYVIVFNGEIYNYKILKQQLINKFNVKFKNKTDTAVLLESIAINGLKNTLKKLEGMFAFALWDKKKESLYLARDRFGEKPLFYYLNNNFLVFSSELKTIKKFFDNSKLEINNTSCNLFASLGYIPAPLTIYKNTFKVLPSEIIEIKNDKVISNEKYWDVRKINESSLTLNQNKIDLLLEDSVKKMMVADVEVGCFLSGGIDSSLVASLMQKNSIKKVKTFTIGFKEKQYDESNNAKKIADHLGTNHHELIVSMDDLIKNIDKVTEMYDEPFGDSSFLPTDMVCQLAKKHLKVVLSGDGGDEIFLGYNRYIQSRKIEAFNKIVPEKMRFILQFLLKKIPSGLFDYLSIPLQKQMGIHGFSHKVQKVANLLNFKNSIDFYKKLNLIDNHQSDFIHNHKIFNKCEDLIKSTQINDINYYLPNDILVKVDRASMSNSLEVRSPFLDPVLVNEIFKIPTNEKIKDNKLKFILRNSLQKYLPQELFERPKMGFAIPLDNWLNKRNVIELFDDVFYYTEWEKLSYDSERVKKIWSSYKKYKKHTPTIIWNYAVAGLWLRNN